MAFWNNLILLLFMVDVELLDFVNVMLGVYCVFLSTE